jgi:CheY-like chemotaxis protein
MLEQVIMNLAVNARDAMPKGGQLLIATEATDITAAYLHQCPEARVGRHVCLSVTDTGCGMAKETLDRIFEPFFTTKPVGKGTGLGLATVYGIVKQFDGYVYADSVVGQGTTFRVYLPRVAESATAADNRPAAAGWPSGTETILLVEDNDMVRNLAARVLRTQGYLVLEAAHGEEALQRGRAHAGEIHLLLTDVVMPRLSGRVLLEKMRETRPQMRVLFMSGYTDDVIAHHGVLDAGVSYLQKPFAIDALLAKLREVLDAGGAARD